MLRIISSPGTADEHAAPVRVGTMTIGRTKENDVFVLHKSLSRQHARLDNDGTRLVLTDLESKNGTFVGRDRITTRILSPGDRFRCGDVVFELREGEAPSSQAPTPSLVADTRRDLSNITIEDLLGPPSTYGSLRLGAVDAATRAQGRLDVLLKVAQLLGKPKEIDVLLGEAVDLVLRIMDVDRAAVLLVDEATGKLVPRITRAARGAASERFFSAHIVEWVREHRTAALFGDAVAEAPADAVASIIAQSICSSICAPLQVSDRLLGVLYVDNLSTPDRFNQEDLDFLGAFAGQVAIAIENATLWRRVEREAALRSTLTRFFPPATVQRLDQEGGASLGVIETEVTALFADISGFTAMSSTMTPRSIVDMLNEYFPLMADAVFRHGGTLEKYIGDALMAVWGAPFAMPDDVDRAVRAAVEMQREIEALNSRRARSGQAPIRIHIGLNTGTVAAGNIGSDRYLQYATIGDATNVASRACGCAGPGQIVVTEATRAKLRAMPRPTAPMPPVPVKGKSEPLLLHSVIWSGKPCARGDWRALSTAVPAGGRGGPCVTWRCEQKSSASRSSAGCCSSSFCGTQRATGGAPSVQSLRPSHGVGRASRAHRHRRGNRHRPGTFAGHSRRRRRERRSRVRAPGRPLLHERSEGRCDRLPEAARGRAQDDGPRQRRALRTVPDRSQDVRRRERLPFRRCRHGGDGRVSEGPRRGAVQVDRPGRWGAMSGSRPRWSRPLWVSPSQSARPCGASARTRPAAYAGAMVDLVLRRRWLTAIATVSGIACGVAPQAPVQRLDEARGLNAGAAVLEAAALADTSPRPMSTPRRPSRSLPRRRNPGPAADMLTPLFAWAGETIGVEPRTRVLLRDERNDVAVLDTANPR